MIPNLSEPSGWLPLFFLVAMGIAMVAYVVLDGYDLGVGILLNHASEQKKTSWFHQSALFGMRMKRGWCLELACF